MSDSRKAPTFEAVDLRFRRVAVLLHPHRAVEGLLERSLVPSLQYLTERTEVFLDEDSQVAAAARRRIEDLGVQFGPREAIIGQADLVITYGGDGSLIAAVSYVRKHNTCLLGINAGDLGFLTEGNLEEGSEILRQIFEGSGWLDRRMQLLGSVYRGEDKVVEWGAINDVVIRQGRINSLLVLDAFIDGVEVLTFRSDGVIAATPSGSTAYALGVGGPIVHPSLKCIELAPIAPFTLSARSIIMPADGVIQLILENTHHDATITFDGQRIHDLETGDLIEIRAGRAPVNFIRVKRDDYYRTLREKLGWHQDRR